MDKKIEIPDAYSVPLDKIHPAEPALFKNNVMWSYFERLRKEDPVHYCKRPFDMGMGEFLDEEIGPYWSITKYNDIMDLIFGNRNNSHVVQELEEFEDDDDETRRTQQISRTIIKVLKGEARLQRLLDQRRMPEPRIHAFTVEPEVVISNTWSDRFTVIEVSGLDRPGLLYDLTSAISDLKLDITSAHITTYGEKAVDVFYVTDLTNKKVIDPPRQEAIRKRLTQVLANETVDAV